MGYLSNVTEDLQAQIDRTTESASGTPKQYVKKLQIGTWNMNTTAIKPVTHGITSGRTKIKSMFVKIYNHGLGQSISLEHDEGSGGGWFRWNDGTISMGWVTGGYFDDVAFGALGASDRGEILITYEL